MLLQGIIVGVFVLNFVLVWLLVFGQRLTAYRFIAPLFFIGSIIVSVFLEQPRFDLDYFWWRIVGVVFMVIGAALFAWAALEFRKAKNLIIAVPQKLVTTGPFAIIRHPFYLAAIFMAVGWWWFWAAVYSFYFGMIILVVLWLEAYFEEKLVLEKSFADQYKQYKASTGMFWIK